MGVKKVGKSEKERNEGEKETKSEKEKIEATSFFLPDWNERHSTGEE